MTKVYEISGMTCGGCASSVTRALEHALPGVTVQVSLEDGVARVEGEHDPARAREAIEDAGFEVA